VTPLSSLGNPDFEYDDNEYLQEEQQRQFYRRTQKQQQRKKLNK